MTDKTENKCVNVHLKSHDENMKIAIDSDNILEGLQVSEAWKKEFYLLSVRHFGYSALVYCSDHELTDIVDELELLPQFIADDGNNENYNEDCEAIKTGELSEEEFDEKWFYCGDHYYSFDQFVTSTINPEKIHFTIDGNGKVESIVIDLLGPIE